jgi:hypothetical protein
MTEEQAQELLFCCRWIRETIRGNCDAWCAIRTTNGAKDWVERLKKIVAEVDKPTPEGSV